MTSARPDTRSDDIQPSRARPGVGWIVFAVIVAIVIAWVAIDTSNDRSPAEAVEDYLTAIANKDVGTALELAGGHGASVPYGRQAAFLTASAIADDWWVVSVEETGQGEYSSERRVKATIAGENGTASAEFDVGEFDDDWYLTDPFVQVTFPKSPLSYVQVNDQIVPLESGIAASDSFQLFPGPYRFFQSVPGVVDTPKPELVAAVPDGDTGGYNERNVVPGTLTPTAGTVRHIQQAINDRIDECATFATEAPFGDCPFATDGEIDTTNGKRVTDPWGLSWKVVDYPEISVKDDRQNEYAPGFAVSVTKPGTVTLSGTGLDTDDKPTRFSVTCGLDLSFYLVTIDADGKAELGANPNHAVAYAGDFNTCQRNP
jgi:hypothetical protein